MPDDLDTLGVRLGLTMARAVYGPVETPYRACPACGCTRLETVQLLSSSGIHSRCAACGHDVVERSIIHAALVLLEEREDE